LIENISFAQIPNANFEDWEVRDSLEQLIGWNANINSRTLTLEKDTVSFTGNFAARIKSKVETFEGLGGGLLRTTITVDQIPTKLNAVVKCDTLVEGGRCIITVEAINDGRRREVGKWIRDRHIFLYREVEVPLVIDSLPDALRITLEAGTTSTGFSYEGYSEFVVDSLWFDEFVHTTDLREGETLTAFPNPTIDQFTIVLTEKQSYENALLYNSSGQLLRQFRIATSNQLQVDVSDLPNGNYHLRLVGDAYFQVVPFIVSR
jgi:hypothetical protein